MHVHAQRMCVLQNTRVPYMCAHTSMCCMQPSLPAIGRGTFFFLPTQETHLLNTHRRPRRCVTMLGILVH